MLRHCPIQYTMLSESVTLRALNVYGVMKDPALAELKTRLNSMVKINAYPLSSVARPTVGIRRTSLWHEKVH